jgi:chromosome segregation ATPase
MDSEEIRTLSEAARHYESNWERVHKAFKALPKVAQLVIQASQHVSEMGTKAAEIAKDCATLEAKQVKLATEVAGLERELASIKTRHFEVSAAVNKKCEEENARGAEKIVEIRDGLAKKVAEAEATADRRIKEVDSIVATFIHASDIKKQEIKDKIDVMTKEKEQAELKLRTIQDKLAEIKSKL